MASGSEAYQYINKTRTAASKRLISTRVQTAEEAGTPF